MSSPEYEVLQEQVVELAGDMKDMKLSVSGLLTLESRMKAVEAQQRAQDARLEHIDRVVMSIQTDIQKLQKTFGALEPAISDLKLQRSADASVLKEILTTQQRMLSLLQPSVVVSG
jgi:uncharacterized coiled-coil protein SlyX